MNIGTEFEQELAKEFGLERVPGSGSTWHSKLDLSGSGFRWSLKATIQQKFPLRFIDVLEALEACFGPGGDGSKPIWAVRNRLGDFIVMRKEDFIALQSKEINLIETDRPQVAERKKKAKTPELLRGID